jgi:hypothetical protein
MDRIDELEAAATLGAAPEAGAEAARGLGHELVFAQGDAYRAYVLAALARVGSSPSRYQQSRSLFHILDHSERYIRPLQGAKTDYVRKAAGAVERIALSSRHWDIKKSAVRALERAQADVAPGQRGILRAAAKRIERGQTEEKPLSPRAEQALVMAAAAVEFAIIVGIALLAAWFYARLGGR